MIVGLRTDSFDAELHLLNEKGKRVGTMAWHAGRELSVQILQRIDDLLLSHDASLEGVTGVVVYQGPGSFTGLRIGIAVANAIGYGLDVPVACSTGEDWIETSYKEIKDQPIFTPVQPMYGADPHITQPRK